MILGPPKIQQKQPPPKSTKIDSPKTLGFRLPLRMASPLSNLLPIWHADLWQTLLHGIDLFLGPEDYRQNVGDHLLAQGVA